MTIPHPVGLAAALAATLAVVASSANSPAAAAGARSAPAPWTWTVTELPGLPGGHGANVTGADGTGRLFGTAGDATGHPHLVSWRAGNITDLDATFNWSTALGNRHGVIAGTIAPPDGTHHAAHYVDGRASLLPEPPGTLSTGVIAVDDAGNLVGQASGFDWQVHAVMWPAARPGTVEFISVPPGMGSGGAFGIGSAAMGAGDGRIVGYAGVTGYIWTTAGRIAHTILPTSPGDALNLLATSDGVEIGTEWVEAEGVNRAVEVDRRLRLSPLPDSHATVAFTGTDRLVGGQDSATLQAICWADHMRATLPVPAGTLAGFPRVTAGRRSLAGSTIDRTFTQHPVVWTGSPARR